MKSLRDIQYRLATLLSGFRCNLSFSNRFQITWDRLFRRNLTLAHYIWKNRFVLVCNTKLGDHISIQECLSERAYDRLLDRCRFPAEGITYVNVGANIGCFDVLLIERGLKIEAGLAVELNPHTFARCLVNFQTNGLLATRLVNAGIAGENGSLRFQPSAFSLVDSIYRRPAPDSTGAMPVELLTLEALLEKHAGHFARFDLLKLDCERAEYPILRLSPLKVLGRFQYILIEFHPVPEGESVGAAYARLQEAGFTPAFGAPPGRDVFTELFVRS